MKRILCFLFVVILVTLTAAINALAYSITDEGIKTVDEAVKEAGVTETRRYWFIMPDGKNGMKDTETGEYAPSWYNEYTDDAGIYWWDGDAKPDGWCGYKAMKGDAENVYYADVPVTVTSIIWNNGIDRSADPSLPIYSLIAQTVIINTENAEPGEYDTLPNGTPESEGFDNMVYVICPDNYYSELSYARPYRGQWYYYYGRGCYGLIKGGESDVKVNCVNPDHDHTHENKDDPKDDSNILLTTGGKTYRLIPGKEYKYVCNMRTDARVGLYRALLTCTNGLYIIPACSGGDVEPIESYLGDDDGNMRYYAVWSDASGKSFSEPGSELLFTKITVPENVKEGTYTLSTSVDLLKDINEDPITDYSLFEKIADLSPVDTELLPGDADKDGEVTIFDATRIQRYLAELASEDEVNLKAADADSDNEVTIFDATRIQRYLAELCEMDGSLYIE